MSDLTVINTDNIDAVPTLAGRSVQMVCTSPPYYGLRDYGLEPTAYPEIEYTPMPGLPPLTIPAQTVCLGLESTPEAYTAHLVHLFRLIWPVLADDGVAWINIGDSYASSGRAGNQNLDKLGQRYGGGGHKQSSQKSGRAPTPPGLKTKDLIGIPWRLAFALQADGWYLRNDCIWHKPNAMPESVTDRCAKDHEYVFLMSKQERYYFNSKAIRESLKFPNDTRKGDYRLRPNNGASKGTKAELGTENRMGNHPDGRNRRTCWSIDPESEPTMPEFWSIATKALAAAHYAPMPEALAEIMIRSGSRPGDTVLDPFGGTGTTGRVALANNRRAISIDKNPAYIEIHNDRTAIIQRKLI